MRLSSCIGVMLLAAVPCCAWAQPPQGSTGSREYTPPEYGGSVYGHVFCADTNAPARFARVMLTSVGTSSGERGGFPQSATTGLDGSFAIEHVRPGAYYVTASVPGYVNPLSEVAQADLVSTDAAAQARVASVLTMVRINGNEPAHAELRLERGAAISGTVYYDDGSPAQNVQISVQAPTGSSAATGYSVWTSRSFSFMQGQLPPRTDDYGRYRITGLPTGDYVVVAAATLGGMGLEGGGRGQTNTLAIYAPKSVRSADATTYTVKAGSELNGVDMIIPLAAFHTVSGTAESSDGHTLNAGYLTLTDDKDKTNTFHASVQSDGSFRFLYVPEGSYTLAISGAAITEPTSGGHGRTTTVASYGNATQSVLVQSGDLANVVVQAPAKTQGASGSH